MIALDKYRSQVAKKLVREVNSDEDDIEDALAAQAPSDDEEHEDPVGEEVEEKEPETYEATWTCENCKHTQQDDFPFGTTVQDALSHNDVYCSKCGCY